jgi:hypothetical protein
MAKAATQFQKGLDQLALLSDGLERQRQELEFCSARSTALQASKGYAAPDTGQAYARARELWEQLGSPSEFLQIPYGQSLYHVSRGELNLGLRIDKGLIHLSRQRNDAAGLVLGHLSLGRDFHPAGRFAPSRSHLEEALALYNSTSHGSPVQQAVVHPQVASQAYLGNVLFCLGLPDQALARSSAAIAEARRLAHLPSLAASLVYSAGILSLVGECPTLSRRLPECLPIRRRRC